MDANTIIHLVGSLGFPIVCCIGLGYFIITIAITKLIDKLDKEG